MLRRLVWQDQAANPSKSPSALFSSSSLPLIYFTNYSYAVLFLGKNDSDDAIALLDPLVKAMQDTTADTEAIFRALIALGTALSIPSDEIRVAAKQVFGVKEALDVVRKSAKENRVKEVITEIASLLS